MDSFLKVPLIKTWPNDVIHFSDLLGKALLLALLLGSSLSVPFHKNKQKN